MMIADSIGPVSQLRATLAQLEAGTLRPDVTCARFRMATLQWHSLPDRYATVLERLLAPLDTAVMLGEDSCTFSRADVVQSLHQWLDHAAQLPNR